jgi:hypothetical protein
MELPAYPKIQQKTLTVFKSFRAGSDRLFVNTKNLHEELSYTIRFDDMGFDIVRKRNKTANIPFYIFLAFDVLYLWLLINSIMQHEIFFKQLFWAAALLLFAALSIGSYSDRNKETIFLTGGSSTVELLASKPNREAVQRFIEDLHAHMRKYFKDKYLADDLVTPPDIRLQQLKWLVDIKAITESEYLSGIQHIRGFLHEQVPTRDN